MVCPGECVQRAPAHASPQPKRPRTRPASTLERRHGRTAPELNCIKGVELASLCNRKTTKGRRALGPNGHGRPQGGHACARACRCNRAKQSYPAIEIFVETFSCPSRTAWIILYA